MLKILLCGCMGRMGRAVAELVSRDEDAVVAAGVDRVPGASADFPVYPDLSAVDAAVDAVVDFSHRSALPAILAFCARTGTPAVLASTGYTAEDDAAVAAASETLALFRSANMSLGVALLTHLTAIAARELGDDFDVEIIERHHNKKLDAPSGTALHLAETVRAASASPKTEIYDRHAVRRERGKAEIGMHSVRGGTIIGEHEVLFAGWNETISLSHSAQSREVFAAGALRAARFLAAVGKPGLYGMEDLFRRP